MSAYAWKHISCVKKSSKRGWLSFKFRDDHDDDKSPSPNLFSNRPLEDYDDRETLLYAIVAITPNKIEFMNTEANQADKVRQI